MPGQFGLMDPGQLGQSIQNAFLMGAQQRALSNYAQHPSMDSATGVTGLNPEVGIRLQDRELERQKVEAKQQHDARAQQLQARAAQGDKAALAELAGVDINAWNTIGDNERQDITERVHAIGQAALAVSQIPEQNRAQAWDSYVGQLSQRWPDLAQYQGHYSPEALQSALSQAGMVKDALDLGRPQYMAIPPGGTLVNTRDPQAIQQFGAQQAPQQTPQQGAEQGGQDGPFPFQAYQGAVNSLGPQKAAEWLQRNGIIVSVQTPDQAHQLPSGATYVTPDGRMMRIP